MQKNKDSKKNMQVLAPGTTKIMKAEMILVIIYQILFPKISNAATKKKQDSNFYT